MSVKIFLPDYLFHTKENCDIYGEIQINENNAVSYYIIAHLTCETGNQAQTETKNLRHLGFIYRAGQRSTTPHRDVALSFAYDDETPNIYLLNLSIKPADTTEANVFLYDVPKMLELHQDSNQNAASHASNIGHSSLSGQGGGDNDQINDVDMLCCLLISNQQQNGKLQNRSIIDVFTLVLFFLPTLITRILILLFESRPLIPLLRRTVLYEHYLEWRRYRDSGKRKLNITVDKVLGVCVMLFLLFYVAGPGDYLLTTSHLVIQKLRLLLRSLKGSPIGLKLNEHLNNFLVDCFNYHIDLWAKFLDLIEPIVRQLFVPIALLGLSGLSFQLASVPVLISIIGLHAHCFYIYTAVLYKVEIKGIQVLWKVMLGKRYNVLKNRVESHNYVNRQLYLATIFFTVLIFLFPTVLTYYVVFTILRLCIYLVNLLLQLFRRSILEFPLERLIKWCIGKFYDIDSVYLTHSPHSPSPLLQPEYRKINMSIFKLNIQKSPLNRVFSSESGILQDFKTDDRMSIKNAFNRMLKGTF